jgi:hypothetical protein
MVYLITQVEDVRIEIFITTITERQRDLHTTTQFRLSALALCGCKRNDERLSRVRRSPQAAADAQRDR